MPNILVWSKIQSHERSYTPDDDIFHIQVPCFGALALDTKEQMELNMRAALGYASGNEDVCVQLLSVDQWLIDQITQAQEDNSLNVDRTVKSFHLEMTLKKHQYELLGAYTLNKNTFKQNRMVGKVGDLKIEDSFIQKLLSDYFGYGSPFIEQAKGIAPNVQNYFSGSAMVILGALLSLTVIGLLVGIPLIVSGLARIKEEKRADMRLEKSPVLSSALELNIDKTNNYKRIVDESYQAIEKANATARESLTTFVEIKRLLAEAIYHGNQIIISTELAATNIDTVSYPQVIEDLRAAKEQADKAHALIKGLEAFAREKQTVNREQAPMRRRDRAGHNAVLNVELQNVVATPVVEQTPVPVVANPVVEQTPAAVVATPVVEQTPAAVVATPVVEQTPVPVVATPVVEQTPAAVVATPVVEQTPAAVVATPVVEQTPAAVVATPVVDPTPAAEPTPVVIVGSKAHRREIADAALAELRSRRDRKNSARTPVATPAADQTPEVAVVTPVVEQTPAVAVTTPVVDQTPEVAVATPVVEQTPEVAVATPVVEQTPEVAVATPVVEQTPAVAVATPVVEQTPAVAVATPVVDQTPAISLLFAPAPTFTDTGMKYDVKEVFSRIDDELLIRASFTAQRNGATQRSKCSTILMADVSGSMRRAQNDLRETINRLVKEQLPHGDEFTLICFGSKGQTLLQSVTVGAPETDEKLAAALLKLVCDENSTDITAAFEQLSKESLIDGHTRIVLLSDGADNVRRPAAEQLTELVKQKLGTLVPVDAIGMTVNINQALLTSLTQTTLGALLFVKERSQINQALNDLGNYISGDRTESGTLTLLKDGVEINTIDIPQVPTGKEGAWIFKCPLADGEYTLRFKLGETTFDKSFSVDASKVTANPRVYALHIQSEFAKIVDPVALYSITKDEMNAKLDELLAKIEKSSVSCNELEDVKKMIEAYKEGFNDDNAATTTSISSYSATVTQMGGHYLGNYVQPASPQDLAAAMSFS